MLEQPPPGTDLRGCLQWDALRWADNPPHARTQLRSSALNATPVGQSWGAPSADPIPAEPPINPFGVPFGQVGLRSIQDWIFLGCFMNRDRPQASKRQCAGVGHGHGCRAGWDEHHRVSAGSGGAMPCPQDGQGLSSAGPRGGGSCSLPCSSLAVSPRVPGVIGCPAERGQDVAANGEGWVPGWGEHPLPAALGTPAPLPIPCPFAARRVAPSGYRPYRCPQPWGTICGVALGKTPKPPRG